MAVQVLTDVVALIWQHPGFSCLVLLLFTPPFFPIVRFFSPLLVSTALFMLALFTMGPGASRSSDECSQQAGEEDENWEFRRAADVKVWEDKSVGGERSVGRRWKGVADGNWIMDWLSNVHDAGLVWVETKFRNENWKGSALNDDNVSILQEASWATTDPSTSGGNSRTVEEDQVVVAESRVLAPSVVLSKVESKLKHVTAAPEPVKDAPGLEEPSKRASSVHHEPLVHLQVPMKAAKVTTIDESPSTDLDESSDLERSRRFLFSTVRRDSTNASSGLSDIDTPVAAVVMAQSKSGKLKQMETLGDFIEESSTTTSHHSSPAHDLPILQPTTADQVDAVKDKLHDFTRRSESIEVQTIASEKVIEATVAKKLGAPGSPLFKGSTRTKLVTKSVTLISDGGGSSSGDEQFTDSDSDSEFEIFPPVDPTKMKLHPPVKLDIQQLEKKLGTSLSQRTRATSPPKSEISEVH